MGHQNCQPAIRAENDERTPGEADVRDEETSLRSIDPDARRIDVAGWGQHDHDDVSLPQWAPLP